MSHQLQPPSAAPAPTPPTLPTVAGKSAAPASWRPLLCGLLLSIFTLAVWFAGPSFGYEDTTLPMYSSAGLGAPPAAEIEGIAAWLNGEPATLSNLRGQVVLLDFWTYTCVNCIRTIPHLQAWQRQYADAGLAILGIHTPEFEFERDPANVARAARSLGITWRIALDNDYVTWDNYENIFWPTKYLIDARGRQRHYQVGEGGYADFEEKLRALLAEAGRDLSATPPVSGPARIPDHVPDSVYEAAPDREITRELYAGYLRGDFEREYYGRGFVGQREYYSRPGTLQRYDRPQYLEPGFLYFQGVWENGDQQARHGRVARDFEDYVALVYSARSVNAVLSNEGDEPFKVRVLLDGEYLTEANRGADLVIGPDGESYLWVDESRMYRVVEHPAYIQRRELRLSVNSDRLGVYAFTFGIYDRGP